MQSFRPFRATAYRQQKYYSEKRNSGESKGSVFNLPRQIIPQKSIILINPQILKNVPDPQHKIATDYQSNLKKNIKKLSVDIINKKALQRITSSFVQMDSIPRESNQKMQRNKSSEIYPNKSIAFKTLNILYRTIIETKVRTMKKQSFELSAKRLPILQRVTIHQPTNLAIKKGNEVFARNSSFDKYKLNLTTITNDSGKRGVEKYNLSLQRKEDQMSPYDMTQKQCFSGQLATRRRKFERGHPEKVVNEIVPWNMFEVEQEQVSLYD